MPGFQRPRQAAQSNRHRVLHNHDGGQKDHSAIAQYYGYLADIHIGR